MTPPLLCHPDQQPVVRGHRASCPVCGAFWDLEALGRRFDYTDAYPVERKHFDPVIGNLKIATLHYWLSAVGIEPCEHVVCEVDFGAGYCLAHLRDGAADVFGLEAVPSNVAHAASLSRRR
jgi:hypothetical protein